MAHVTLPTSKKLSRATAFVLALVLAVSLCSTTLIFGGSTVQAFADQTTSSASSSATTSKAPSSTTVSGHTTAELSWYPSNVSTFKDFHNTNAPRVVDNANILTESEEAALTEKLTEMKSRLNIDFVVLTDVSSYGLSRQTYAADYFQFNGYGVGDDYSGVIYFVCMEQGNRGYYTAARGSARDLITEENINYMDDKTYDLFKAGEYGTAITTQVDSLDALYTNGSFPADLSFLGFAFVGALFVGLAGGGINLARKKRAMITVERAVEARRYLSERGLQLAVREDHYAGSTYVRVPHPEPEHRGGGGGSSFSGGFSSSGGGSFSGGGRSF